MKYDAIIVGAGFAGMYMLHRLRKAGFSATVLEAADGVGGTWYWNRYPGARCDVKSIDYSFSFDDALQQEWEWSEKYATQPEILRYANHVADRFDLRRDIRFDTRVAAAAYDGKSRDWHITTTAGEQFTAHYYIMATGCLSVPKAIDIPGKERFTGKTYHTADWPREPVDFSGQRVAVIGTGSSAIQSIPIIGAQAAELTVFQRTPAYSLPAFNRPLTADEVRTVKANYAGHREKSRYSLFGVPDRRMDVSALSVSEEERQRRYEEGWESGELVAIMQQFNDLLVSAEANETASEFVRNKIRAIVKDPATAETLCPKTFPLGSKRACLDTNYYALFNEPHVHLIDLTQDPIETITANGIKTAQRSFEFDAIVFATGFDAMTGAIVNVDIRGRDGKTLRDKWADGPRTYLGLATAGFPNLFLITGPGSPSVMSNMMISIEQHVDWITDCLEHARDTGVDTIEASADAENEWVTHVNDVAAGTLFPRANSWYMGANVPGKPQLFMPYIGGVGPYREKCDDVAARGYAGFTLSGADSARPRPRADVSPADDGTDGALDWELLDSRYEPDAGLMLFEKRIDRLRNPRNAQTFDRIVLESVDWVNIVALDAERRCVMIRQYRFGVGYSTLEPPGGMVDPGEDSLTAAARELREETGYAADKWTYLGAVEPNPAVHNNLCHHWLAEAAWRDQDQDLGDGETIAIELMSPQEVIAAASGGEIKHALALSALSRVFSLWPLPFRHA